MLLATGTRHDLAAWCVLVALCGAGCDAARANDVTTAATVQAKAEAEAQVGQAVTPNAASPASEDECNALRAALATQLATAEAALTRPLELSAEQQRCIAQAIPGVPGDATFSLFSTGDIDQALKRGKRSRSQIHVWRIEPAALSWSPLPEQRLIVISGQAADNGVVGVLRAHADGRLEHLASTLIHEEESSIALGSSEQYPRNLMWTTCYECPGAGGNIRFEDDASVSFTYR